MQGKVRARVLPFPVRYPATSKSAMEKKERPIGRRILNFLARYARYVDRERDGAERTEQSEMTGNNAPRRETLSHLLLLTRRFSKSACVDIYIIE